jgi:hypothetical protein
MDLYESHSALLSAISGLMAELTIDMQHSTEEMELAYTKALMAIQDGTTVKHENDPSRSETLDNGGW